MKKRNCLFVNCFLIVAGCQHSTENVATVGFGPDGASTSIGAANVVLVIGNERGLLNRRSERGLLCFIQNFDFNFAEFARVALRLQ